MLLNERRDETTGVVSELIKALDERKTPTNARVQVATGKQVRANLNRRRHPGKGCGAHRRMLIDACRFHLALRHCGPSELRISDNSGGRVCTQRSARHRVDVSARRHQ